jgi:hypothetical protein
MTEVTQTMRGRKIPLLYADADNGHVSNGSHRRYASNANMRRDVVVGEDGMAKDTRAWYRVGD